MVNGQLQKPVLFLSTPSARRATDKVGKLLIILLISIHALREEGDPLPECVRVIRGCISIHALREEGDYRGRNYCRPCI